MKGSNKISSIIILGCVVIVSYTDAWMISVQSKMFQNQFTRSLTTSKTDTTIPTTTTTAGIAEIIGNGRIGSLLAQTGNCKVLSRNDSIDPKNVGQPIYIATRNDALETIVNNCPIERKSDLVFLQNGYLDEFLSSKNILDNTQVLLYLSVPTKGATPVDGITSYNPDGLTTATGIHANAFAERLQALNMKCNIVDSSIYRPAMFEKLMYVTVIAVRGMNVIWSIY
jgi:hypothetical protein